MGKKIYIDNGESCPIQICPVWNFEWKNQVRMCSKQSEIQTKFRLIFSQLKISSVILSVGIGSAVFDE